MYANVPFEKLTFPMLTHFWVDDFPFPVLLGYVMFVPWEGNLIAAHLRFEWFLMGCWQLLAIYSLDDQQKRSEMSGKHTHTPTQPLKDV